MANLFFQGKLIRQFWGKLIRQSTNYQNGSLNNTFFHYDLKE